MPEKNQPQNLDAVIEKINEMRGFFKIGDEIIPFLTDLFKFLQEIIPLMAEISTSIKTSTTSLPKASERIQDVNHTTEITTNEIMDKLDNILNAAETLHKAVGEQEPEAIETIQNEVNDILMALQFQDIISQKLQHANKILSAIHEKFQGLFDSLRNVKVSTILGSSLLEALEREMESQTNQEVAAQLEAEAKDMIRDEGEVTDEDIERLLS